MEAVSSNASVGQSTWQCKGLGDVLLGAMKSRVKAGDLRHMWSGVEDCANGREVVGLMQWRQRFEPFQRCQHIAIHADRAVEFHPAVNDPVTDAYDRRSRNQAAGRGEYFPCGSIVVEPLSRPGALNQSVAVGVLDIETRADADTLDLPVEQGVGIAGCLT